MNLPDSLDRQKDLSKKIAFLAVFGITGIVAVTTYKYLKKQLSFDDLDWGEVWKDMK